MPAARLLQARPTSPLPLCLLLQAAPAAPPSWRAAAAFLARRAYGSSKEDAPLCEVPGFEDKRMKLLRHVSFVDCPGHDILMVREHANPRPAQRHAGGEVQYFMRALLFLSSTMEPGAVATPRWGSFIMSRPRREYHASTPDQPGRTLTFSYACALCGRPRCEQNP